MIGSDGVGCVVLDTVWASRSRARSVFLGVMSYDDTLFHGYSDVRVPMWMFGKGTSLDTSVFRRKT